MTFVFEFFTLAITMLIDLSAGNLGFALPAAGIVLFYFGLVGSFPRAAAAAAGYGLVLDLIYGRPYPVSALVLPVALAAGAALQHRIDSYLLDAAPLGAAVAFTVTLGNTLAGWLLSGRAPETGPLIWRLLFNSAMGAAALPAGILLLDEFGEALGLKSCRRIRLRAERHTLNAPPRRIREPQRQGKK